MRFFSLFFCFAMALGVSAADFAECFADSTLRLTYSFAQSPSSDAAIYIESMETTPGWAGRRHNLSRLPLRGNGQIFVTDHTTGDTIYATSFNTLFDEWRVTNEAKSTARSFRYSFLVPVPRAKADLTIKLFNEKGVSSEMTHTFDPNDILVRHWSGQPRKFNYIQQGGSPEDAIDVVIVPEGYTAEQMDLFEADARRVVEAILGHEPFTSLANRFNFLTVELPSADGEVSHPNRNEWHDTRYDSHYSTLYSDRYHTTPSSVKVHEDLRGIPYEHIIMLANTEQYGGGGFYNLLTTAAAHHPTMPDVVTHEFGHSFGGLADEYFYPGDTMGEMYAAEAEPWEQNITNLVDFESKPWSRLLSPEVPVPTDPADADKYPVGLYEGGGYITKGMYRPADKCRMRVNDYPTFCPVCQDALTRLILFYTE